MRIELTGFKKVMFTIAAISTCFISMAEMAVNPAIFAIMETYGYDALGSYCISAPALCAGIAALVATALMSKISKKTLMIAAATIFTLSGFFACAVPDVGYYAVMRSIMGVGEGLISAVLMAYVATLFFEPAQHASFMGIWNVGNTIVGAALSLAGGFLAIPEWQNIFTMFILGVVVIILIALFMPALSRLDAEEADARESHASAEVAQKSKLPGVFWAFIVNCVLFCLMVGLNLYFGSEYIEETGLGGADTAGIYMMVYTLVGIIPGFVFGKLFMSLKRRVSTLSFALMIIAFLLMYFVEGNAVVVMIAFILAGLAFGLFYPYMFAMGALVVAPDRIDLSMSAATACYQFSFFAITFIVNGLRMVLAPETGMVVPQFLAFCLLGVIAIVINLATHGSFKKFRETQDELPQGH